MGVGTSEPAVTPVVAANGRVVTTVPPGSVGVSRWTPLFYQEWQGISDAEMPSGDAYNPFVDWVTKRNQAQPALSDQRAADAWALETYRQYTSGSVPQLPHYSFTPPPPDNAVPVRADQMLCRGGNCDRRDHFRFCRKPRQVARELNEAEAMALREQDLPVVVRELNERNPSMAAQQVVGDLPVEQRKKMSSWLQARSATPSSNIVDWGSGMLDEFSRTWSPQLPFDANGAPIGGLPLFIQEWRTLRQRVFDAKDSADPELVEWVENRDAVMAKSPTPAAARETIAQYRQRRFEDFTFTPLGNGGMHEDRVRITRSKYTDPIPRMRRVTERDDKESSWKPAKRIVYAPLTSKAPILSMRTDVTGPPQWRFMHSLPHVTEGKCDPEKVQRYLRGVGRVMPCQTCRHNYAGFVKDNNISAISTTDDWNSWVVAAHNDVNARAGKPKWSPDKAREYYQGYYGPNWEEDLMQSLYFNVAYLPNKKHYTDVCKHISAVIDILPENKMQARLKDFHSKFTRRHPEEPSSGSISWSKIEVGEGDHADDSEGAPPMSGEQAVDLLYRTVELPRDDGTKHTLAERQAMIAKACDYNNKSCKHC